MEISHHARSNIDAWKFWLKLREMLLMKFVGCAGLPRVDVEVKFHDMSVDVAIKEIRKSLNMYESIEYEPIGDEKKQHWFYLDITRR